MSSQKDKNRATRTYLKVGVTYLCSKDTCISNGSRTQWKSIHGWDRDENLVKCSSCDSKVAIMEVKDEMLKLDCYNCPNEECEGYSWTSLHNGLGPHQECALCGQDIPPERNPQERYGRHYWLGCVNKDCKNPQKWEDCTTEGLYSQRCRLCHSRGEIVAICKLPRRRRNQRRIVTGLSDGAAAHMSELCDMCNKIKLETNGQTCHRFSQVSMEVSGRSGSGVSVEKITKVS